MPSHRRASAPGEVLTRCHFAQSMPSRPFSHTTTTRCRCGIFQQPDVTDGKVSGSAMVEVENLAHLERIMKAARRVKGIAVVTRREKITAEE